MTDQHEYVVNWRLDGQTRVYAETPQAAADLVHGLVNGKARDVLRAVFGPVGMTILRTRETAAPTAASSLARTDREDVMRHAKAIEAMVEAFERITETKIPQPRDRLMINHGEAT